MAVDFYVKTLIKIKHSCDTYTISTIKFQSSYKEMEICVKYLLKIICLFLFVYFYLFGFAIHGMGGYLVAGFFQCQTIS